MIYARRRGPPLQQLQYGLGIADGELAGLLDIQCGNDAVFHYHGVALGPLSEPASRHVQIVPEGPRAIEEASEK